MLDEVGAPLLERQCVVVAQVLLVQHLQPDVLYLGDNPPRSGQLSIREDIAINEIPCDGRRSIVGPRDAVVEQQTAGLQS